MKNLTIKYLLLAGAILGPVANVSAMDKLQSDVTEIKSMVTRILSYHEKEATAPEATAGGGGGGGGGVAASAVPPDPIDMHKKIRLLISRASRDERLYPAVLAAIAEAKANNFDFDLMPGSSPDQTLLRKARLLYGFKDESDIIKALIAAAGATEKERE